MKASLIFGLLLGFFGLMLGLALSEAEAKCAQDSVQIGKWCVDKYEASVWETTDKGTIKKIQKGQIRDRLRMLGIWPVRQPSVGRIVMIMEPAARTTATAAWISTRCRFLG